MTPKDTTPDPVHPAPAPSLVYAVADAIAKVIHGPEFDPFDNPEAFDFATSLATAALSAIAPAPSLVEAVDADWLTDILSDSIDMDWTPRVGADAIMRALGESHPSAFAWLIEMPHNGEGAPRWWNPAPNKGWVYDANEAMRFCREQDAKDYLAGNTLLRGRPTEHVFVATAALSVTAPAPSLVEDFLTQLRRVNSERYDAWATAPVMLCEHCGSSRPETVNCAPPFSGQSHSFTKPHPYLTTSNDAGMMFDALELGGEVGELLNVVKKLEREERGWRGSRAGPDDFADECADVLICLDKLARRKGVDLAAATVRKFNATSDKVGLPQKLTTALSVTDPAIERMRAAIRAFIADIEWRELQARTNDIAFDLTAASVYAHMAAEAKKQLLGEGAGNA